MGDKAQKRLSSLLVLATFVALQIPLKRLVADGAREEGPEGGRGGGVGSRRVEDGRRRPRFNFRARVGRPAGAGPRSRREEGPEARRNQAEGVARARRLGIKGAKKQRAGAPKDPGPFLPDGR
jgi:hypothetical protein